MRLRNILFSLSLVIVLLGPAALVYAEACDLPVPSWLSPKDAMYLSGGYTATDVAAVFSVEGFTSGNLQNELETAVGNSIPGKAYALQVSAALQHDAIALSNRLFSWSCYPAFYGSTMIDVPSEKRFLEMPQEDSGDRRALTEEFSRRLNSFAVDFPDVTFDVLLAPTAASIDDSDVAQLVSDPFLYSEEEAILVEGAEHYKVIDRTVSYEDFKKQWFGTDHHWNMLGAYDAYLDIVEQAEIEGKPLDIVSATEYDAPVFYGSFARRGLKASYHDHIVDFIFSEPLDLSVDMRGSDGTAESLAHQELYSAEGWDKNKFANRYAEYFHGDYSYFEIHNAKPQIDSDLLILSDSYSNCMERLLASHFRTTYVIDPPRSDSFSLAAFLREHPDVNDVVFIMIRSTMTNKATLDCLVD